MDTNSSENAGGIGLIENPSKDELQWKRPPKRRRRRIKVEEKEEKEEGTT